MVKSDRMGIKRMNVSSGVGDFPAWSSNLSILYSAYPRPIQSPDVSCTEMLDEGARLFRSSVVYFGGWGSNYTKPSR